MIRSALALAAVLGLAVGSGAAFAACTDSEHVSTGKQTVASADGKSSTKVVVPSSGKDG
jgi:predicted ribosomally synthesized peptide with SipW-like signal peptide